MAARSKNLKSQFYKYGTRYVGMGHLCRVARHRLGPAAPTATCIAARLHAGWSPEQAVSRPEPLPQRTLPQHRPTPKPDPTNPESVIAAAINAAGMQYAYEQAFKKLREQFLRPSPRKRPIKKKPLRKR